MPNEYFLSIVLAENVICYYQLNVSIIVVSCNLVFDLFDLFDLFDFSRSSVSTS
jgi:hypothetical protein